MASLLKKSLLSFTHPVKQASCGETAPWLAGASQLEAGSSCPVRCDDLSHHQKQPLAFLTICQLDGTYNWWLLLPVFLSSSNSWMKLECSLQMTGLGRVYGSSGLPNYQYSSLCSFWCASMERIWYLNKLIINGVMCLSLWHSYWNVSKGTTYHTHCMFCHTLSTVLVGVYLHFSIIPLDVTFICLMLPLSFLCLSIAFFLWCQTLWFVLDFKNCCLWPQYLKPFCLQEDFITGNFTTMLYYY